MPAWAWSLITILFSALVAFVLPRLRTTSQANTDTKFKDFEGRIKALEECRWTLEQHQQLEHRLTTIESDVKVIRASLDIAKSTQTDLLRLLEKALIPVAHSPHTPELDRLLEKRDRGEHLTREELAELLWRLKEQANLETTPGKQIALLGLRAVLLAQLRQQSRERRLEASQ